MWTPSKTKSQYEKPRRPRLLVLVEACSPSSPTLAGWRSVLFTRFQAQTQVCLVNRTVLEFGVIYCFLLILYALLESLQRVYMLFSKIVRLQ